MSSTTGLESETDSQPPAPTVSAEAEWIDEPSDEEFSLVDPLLYAPLMLVGAALVVFPEPLTSGLGLLLVAAGLVVAVIDLLSPSERNA